MADPITLVTSHLDQLRNNEDEWLEGTVVDRGLLLARLRRLASTVASIADEVEESLVGSMETEVVEVPGLLRMERTESRRSTWHDEASPSRMRDDLAGAVAIDVALDVGTGELDPVKRNIALATMRAAYEALPSFSSLKQAGARRFGLNIGNYRAFSTTYKVMVETLEEG